MRIVPYSPLMAIFQEWVEWYNMEKPHRNLPEKHAERRNLLISHP
ncbi:MAG: hypothetical protein ACOC4M_15385 [Promethearchaeia archaeon]